MNRQQLIEEIRRLKIERDAVILAHNYQRPEIQQIADALGDSLQLARDAMRMQARTIVFCGVHFMAESARILCPDKTVLLPEIDAGCPLADCATPDQVREMRRKHPAAVFIAYINTSAAVKAECDVCATSANAMDIIAHYPDREIVYLPDKNLAAYAEERLNRSIIRWPGQCYVHDNLITVDTVLALKRQHPDAVVLAHPEAPMPVLELADVVTGTGGMLKAARTMDAREFIIATERGLAHRLRTEIPGKVFHDIPAAICSQMKLTTLDKVFEALKYEKHVIEVPYEIAEKARQALNRMLEISG